MGPGVSLPARPHQRPGWCVRGRSPPDCDLVEETTAGLTALQLYDVAGSVVAGRAELVIGTHDNGVWSSTDGGVTWPNEVCCEPSTVGVCPSATMTRAAATSAWRVRRF